MDRSNIHPFLKYESELKRHSGPYAKSIKIGQMQPTIRDLFYYEIEDALKEVQMRDNLIKK